MISISMFDGNQFEWPSACRGDTDASHLRGASESRASKAKGAASTPRL